MRFVRACGFCECVLTVLCVCLFCPCVVLFVWCFVRVCCFVSVVLRSCAEFSACVLFVCVVCMYVCFVRVDVVFVLGC